MEKAHKGTGTLLLLASVSFKICLQTKLRCGAKLLRCPQIKHSKTSPATCIEQTQVCEHTRDAGTSRPGTPRSGTS